MPQCYNKVIRRKKPNNFYNLEEQTIYDNGNLTKT